MVYLIGGSSRVGKTMIAQTLLERWHVPYLSLDHLKMGLIHGGLTALSAEQDRELRYFMWPTVVGIVQNALRTQKDLIIEGCYIPGEWQESFTPSELERIRCVFVVMSERYIRSHFDAIVAFSNVMGDRGEDRADLERLVRCSQCFKQDAVRNGFPYYEIDEEYRPCKIARAVEELLCRDPLTPPCDPNTH